MKYLLCLFLCFCVNFDFSTLNKIPNKYKNNPFLMQLYQEKNNTNESNGFLKPPAQDLHVMYSHNPFLSQLLKKNTPTPTTTTTTTTRKPPQLTNDRLRTTVNHRNAHLLPSRDTCGFQESSDRIHSGREATIGQFPWMVVLEYSIKMISIGYQCGGILINNRYVLTAAHCVKGKSMSNGEKLFKVRLGEHDIYKLKDCDNEFNCNDPPIDVGIEESILHHDYDVNDKNFHHDIALLRLRQQINMTHFIQPICLPLGGERTKPGVHLHIAGWGLRGDYESLSQVKITADIPYIKDSVCKKLWRNIDIIDSQFCAGGTTKTSACQGDSGGPIMTTFPKTSQWYAEGIISFGKSECGGDPYPTVYTRISSYVNWILDNLRE